MNQAQDREAMLRRTRGRQMTQSLLAVTGKTIESFEEGKSPKELDEHYQRVHGRLKRAGTGAEH